jgi:hypothetical protein
VTNHLRIIPAGVPPLRRKILALALDEHAKGVREVPAGSNRGPELDKYLPDFTKKLGKPGPPWCCFFYSWVVREALGVWPLGRRHGSCSAARVGAAKLGLWLPAQAALANHHVMPGDAFILARGHIGFVLRLSDTHMNTIEGNTGHRLKIGMRELADPQLLGFINNVPTERAPFARGVLPAEHVGVDSVR